MNKHIVASDASNDHFSSPTKEEKNSRTNETDWRSPNNHQEVITSGNPIRVPNRYHANQEKNSSPAKAMFGTDLNSDVEKYTIDPHDTDYLEEVSTFSQDTSASESFLENENDTNNNKSDTFTSIFGPREPYKNSIYSNDWAGSPGSLNLSSDLNYVQHSLEMNALISNSVSPDNLHKFEDNTRDNCSQLDNMLNINQNDPSKRDSSSPTTNCSALLCNKHYINSCFICSDLSTTSRDSYSMQTSMFTPPKPGNRVHMSPFRFPGKKDLSHFSPSRTASMESLFRKPSSLQFKPYPSKSPNQLRNNASPGHSTTKAQTQLFPSTYSMKGHFNAPTAFVAKNTLYPSTMYKKLISNSYDDLSTIGRENTIPNIYRHNSQEFYSTSPPIRDSSSPRRRFRVQVPQYNFSDFCSKVLEEKIIDTHCHLDFLFQREDHKNTFSAYKVKNLFPHCFEGCVAIFCDPEIYPKKSNWQNLLMETDVWGAFGVHPNNALHFNEEVHFFLSETIQHPKVVALGEIGLDYSRKNFNKDVQKKIFEVQLKLALKYKKPIVIHCRDAEEDCLGILKKMVPRETFIHRHCYTGDWTEAQQWLDAFPNLFIGVTALVTYGNAGQLQEVVQKIPLERLLFETDAPYFVPFQLQYNSTNKHQQGKKTSHPGMVVHVAAQIAATRNIQDIPSFLATIRNNTRKMYNI